MWTVSWQPGDAIEGVLSDSPGPHRVMDEIPAAMFPVTVCTGAWYERDVYASVGSYYSCMTESGWLAVLSDSEMLLLWWSCVYFFSERGVCSFPSDSWHSSGKRIRVCTAALTG